MTVVVTLDEHVLIIRIDRPEKRNAIDAPTRAALRAAWERLRDDDAVWVGILTGTGERAFCAGADLSATNPPDESFAKTRSEEHTSELQSLMRISYAVFCLKKKNKHKKRTHYES